MIYFVIAGSMLGCCGLVFIPTLFGYKTKKLDKLLYIFFTIVLLIFAAFRNKVGLDFDSYKNNYDLVQQSGGTLWSMLIGFNNMEPFFQVLNFISPSFRFLLISCVGLGILTKIVWFYKNSEGKLLCLFIYYCTVYLYYDFGIFRQGIAIAIIWYSFKYIRKRSFFKFCLCIILAMTFHSAAIISLPIYFFGDKEYSRKFYFGLLVVGIISMAIVSKFDVIFEKLNLGLIAYKWKAYTTYLKSSENLLTTIIKRLVVLVMCIECLKYSKKHNVGEVKNNSQWLYLNAYTLSIAELLAFSSIFILATRGTDALYYLYIPLISIIISDKNLPKLARCLVFVVMVALSLNSLITVLLHSAGGTYLPYNFLR